MLSTNTISSKKDLKIVELIAQGDKNKEIEEKLNIKRRMLEKRIRCIYVENEIKNTKLPRVVLALKFARWENKCEQLIQNGY